MQESFWRTVMDGLASAPVRDWVVTHPEAALVTLGFAVVFVVDAVADLPRTAARTVRWARGSRTHAKAAAVARDLRVKSGARFAVLIAPLQDDDTGMLAHLAERAVDVHASGFLFDRGVARAGLPAMLDGADATETARAWSKRADADLVIWGRAGRDAPLWRLYFLTARTRAQNGPAQEIRLIPPQDPTEADKLAHGVAYIFARLALPCAEEADRYRPEKLLQVLAAIDALIAAAPQGLGAEFERLLRTDAARIAFSVGERAQDADMLRRASRLRVRILAETDRNLEPQAWAGARADLGRVHLTLGQMEQDVRRLNAAVEAFHEAESMLRAEGGGQAHADVWLQTARALRIRGEMSNDSSDVKGAVDAYRGALAATQASPSRFVDVVRRELAGVLHALADAGEGAEAYDEVIDLYRAAANDRVKAVDPNAWSQTQYDLGVALAAAGERSGDPQLSYDAMAALRACLKERNKDTDPNAWAQAAIQLGLAMFAIGKGEPASGALEGAARTFKEVLEARPREEDPQAWARVQHNLGAALQVIGERDIDRVSLRNAVQAYRAALEVLSPVEHGFEWAGVQNNLGNALHALGEEGRDPDALEAALAAHRDALSVRTRERAREDWAATRNNMGLVLTTLGETLRDPRRLSEAVEAYRDALSVFRLAGHTRYAELAQRNMERAKELLNSARAGGAASAGDGRAAAG